MKITRSRRFQLLILLLSLFLFPLVISCNTVDNTSLPYAFEGITQAGIENAPPVEVILATDFPEVPESAPVYMIENVDPNYLDSLAKRLGFTNLPSTPDKSDGPYTYIEGSDYKPMTAAPPGARILEAYLNGRIWIYSPTNIQDVPENLPSFEEAVEIAREWLTTNDLYPVDVSSVEEGGSLTVENSETGEITSYWVTVKFMTKLSDIDMYSPSAMVCVGDNGKIMQADVKMTQLKEYETVKLKTPEEALNILKAYLASPVASPSEARECLVNLRSFERLTVTRVTIKYTMNGGYLLPIYVFEGEAYSQNNPNLDAFIGKVDAIFR